ncbi:MAG TPA: CoA pyrophosphatase [Steroidobacteraceae bacterium]|nr:CoA pyrophosphatase [Steroidobacteraceae bacterium]
MAAEVRLDLHRLPAPQLLFELRRRLAAWIHDASDLRVGQYSRTAQAQLASLWPRETARAAVLIPLIDRGDELSVLLTLRADALRHHAGQISFPGGRLEPCDSDAIAAALRETEEEIGLRREFIEVIGLLPDHVVISGFRVTPVIGLVRPGFELVLDPTEVAGTFEAPLRHLLDPATHARRWRCIGGVDVETLDLPWGSFNIWGATAGMLLTLREVLGGMPIDGD